MKVFLPHQLKTTGAVIAPLGLALWLLMQFGVITKALDMVLGSSDTSTIVSFSHTINVLVAFIGFTLFITGIFFLCFAKEKIEDEMINKIRLDSFQFAAFIQIIFISIGFLMMLLLGSPPEGLLMLFFIAALFLFWISYFARFNLTLKTKASNEE